MAKKFPFMNVFLSYGGGGWEWLYNIVSNSMPLNCILKIFNGKFCYMYSTINYIL